MHTDDDKKIKVKNGNSKDEYSDFYTSFNEMKDDEGNNKNKKNKKKKEEPVLKNEDDYSDFYGVDEETEEVYEEKPSKENKNHTTLKIILIAILVIILIVLLFLVFGGKKNQADISLTSEEIMVQAGEDGYISYKILNTEEDIDVTFISLDSNIAIVDENGKVTGISNGETEIKLTYKINGRVKEKTCKIIVSGGSEINKNISLTLKSSSSSWTNKDVTITVEANSVYGINSLQYAVNCESDCVYKNVSDNKIVIKDSGETIVKVIAKDKSNQEKEENVKVLIDKESPSINLLLDQDKVIATGAIEICATCKDDLSGCKQEKICRKYTETKKGTSLVVEDKAGNKKTSKTFDVIIEKNIVEAPCTLSVNNSGIVTAKVNSDAEYFGFNSSYSGTNETSKQISISASKKGDSAAKLVTYYVKSKNGNNGKCTAIVVKECKCTDSKSTDANCPVTCTFSIK